MTGLRLDRRLLAGARSAVAAAVPWHVRAELRAALRQRRLPGLAGARLAKRLTVALALVGRGEMAAAEQVARDVLARDPAQQWAANLVAYLDRLPPLDPAQPALHAAPGGDFRLLPRAGAETAILCFVTGSFMPPAILHRRLAGVPASFLYLRDPRRACYLGGIPSLGADLAATLAALRRVLDGLGARRVLCVGSCGGGHGALRYGLALGADRVLAFVPPIDLTPAFNAHLSHARLSRRVAAAFPGETLDLRRLYLDAARRPRAAIVYGADHWDSRLHGEAMRTVPGTTLHPVAEGAARNIMPLLSAAGALQPLLDDFLAR